MPVKIRLQRHGRKRRPFYYIVVADSRFPRDGRFIERIGDYNPLTVPATINLDVSKAVDWMEKGAQPTDTARAILSFKGAMYKKHLLRGVRKGAFDLEKAESMFQEWLSAKESKIEDRKSKIAADKQAAIDAKKQAEVKKRADEAAAKQEAEAVELAEAEAAKAAEEGEATEAPVGEEAVPEESEEQPKESE